VPAARDTDDLSTVLLYPNPAKGDVTVSFDQEGDGIATVQFINIAGIVMKRVVAAEQSVTLSTSDVPAGLYTLKITRGGTVYNKRLLIER
jgi:hypothetical protein